MSNDHLLSLSLPRQNRCPHATNAYVSDDAAYSRQIWQKVRASLPPEMARIRSKDSWTLWLTVRARAAMPLPAAVVGPCP